MDDEGVVGLFGEADAVVSDAEAKLFGVALELLDIALAGLGEAVEGGENPHGVGAVDAERKGTSYLIPIVRPALVGDRLGTTQLEFASGGWPVWQGQFAPFGQELDTQTTADRYKYTGLELDSESQLDHATFRQYSPVSTRWMTADPFDGSIDASNPQSLNRYSYVNNMPFNFTDPSGLAGFCGFSWGAEAIPGVNYIALAACVGSLIYDVFKFLPHQHHTTASNRPRPGAHVWDEHGSYTAKPNNGIGDILGLSGAGCEFGACGSSFGPGGPSRGSNPLEVTSGAVSGGFILPLFFGVLGPAGSFSYDPKNHLACYGGGIGLSAGHTVSGGPVVVHAKPGNTSEDVLSGWSLSGGYNWTPWFGYQGSKGSSGYTAGYSFGVPGASGAVTYSWCKHTGG